MNTLHCAAKFSGCHAFNCTPFFRYFPPMFPVFRHRLFRHLKSTLNQFASLPSHRRRRSYCANHLLHCLNWIPSEFPACQITLTTCRSITIEGPVTKKKDRHLSDRSEKYTSRFNSANLTYAFKVSEKDYFPCY